LRLWLKADAGVTTGLSGGEPSGRTVGQRQHAFAAENLAPTLVNNVLNHKPVLRFDGVDT
jgi:hypothetical protein